MSLAVAQQAYGGRNARLRRRGRVHSVEFRAWFGVDVPVPSCHIGVSGWDFTRLEPTSDSVTCRRCQRLGAGRAAPPVEVLGGQLALDLDEL